MIKGSTLVMPAPFTLHNSGFPFEKSEPTGDSIFFAGLNSRRSLEMQNMCSARLLYNVVQRLSGTLVRANGL
jgi:hypothetical protein